MVLDAWCLVLGAELRRPDLTTLAVLDSPHLRCGGVRGPGYCSPSAGGMMVVTCPIVPERAGKHMHPAPEGGEDPARPADGPSPSQVQIPDGELVNPLLRMFPWVAVFF